MVNTIEFSIIISSRVQKEILSSWDWYEDQQKGLGDRFVDKILSKMEEI